MKKSMMVPEKSSPEMIAPPVPCHTGSERVMGSSPITVVRDENRMASSRPAAASAMAGMKSMPILRFSLILSITTIELLTTIPKRASRPINAGKDSGVPVSAKIMNTPEMARGITSSTRIALRNDPSWMTMVASMRTAASPMA